MASPIALAQLNAAPAADFVAALGDIFEHSPWVAERAAGRRPFADLPALFKAMTEAMRAADEKTRLELIRAHPDLAGKAARAGALSAASTSEQAGAGLDQLSDAEYDGFQRFNDSYRATHGIPFIICVRRHTRGSILSQMEKRAGAARDTEIETALREIGHIAALRLNDRVAGAEPLPLNGRLSTHVLDTHAGKPAAGVAVELAELDASGERIVARGVTNADGRTDRALIEGRPAPIGRYELRFDIGGYFAARGVELADPPFLDKVPVRFAIAEAEGRYHVPLLATPWSYSTYRGS